MQKWEDKSPDSWLSASHLLNVIHMPAPVAVMALSRGPQNLQGNFCFVPVPAEFRLHGPAEAIWRSGDPCELTGAVRPQQQEQRCMGKLANQICLWRLNPSSKRNSRNSSSLCQLANQLTLLGLITAEETTQEPHWNQRPSSLLSWDSRRCLQQKACYSQRHCRKALVATMCQLHKGQPSDMTSGEKHSSRCSSRSTAGDPTWVYTEAV